MKSIEAQRLLNSVIEKCDQSDPYIILKIKHVGRCYSLANKFLYLFSRSMHDNLISCVILHDIGRFIDRDNHCSAGRDFLEDYPSIYRDVAFWHGQKEKWDNIYNLFVRDIDCLENLMRLKEENKKWDGDVSEHIKSQAECGLVDSKICQTKAEWRVYYNAWIDWNFTFDDIRKEAEGFRL